MKKKSAPSPISPAPTTPLGSEPSIGPITIMDHPTNKTSSPDPGVDHEAADGLHHLMKAEQIKSNPDLMDRIAKHVHSQKKAVKSIKDLRERAKQLDKEDRSEKPETGRPDKEDAQEGEGY